MLICECAARTLLRSDECGHGLLLAAAGTVYFLYKDSTGRLDVAIELYAYTILVWLAVIACFNVFIRFYNRESRFFRFSRCLLQHLFVSPHHRHRSGDGVDSAGVAMRRQFVILVLAAMGHPWEFIISRY
jgi:hypothetical protein